MNSATDPRLPLAPLALAAILLLCVAAAPAATGPRTPAPTNPIPPRGGASARLATPAELRAVLQKAVKALTRAEDALRGKDPGEVGLLLLRADEHLERFQSASGLEALAKALKEARAAVGVGDARGGGAGIGVPGAAGAGAAGARAAGAAETGTPGPPADGSDLAAAAEAVRRARDLMTPLAEYTVLRQGVEAGHAALRAAGAMDRAEFLAALDRLEKATLVPVLMARLREARDGISRGRLAMVRRDMDAGRTQVAAARRACDGLEYAGAMSRASFALSVGAELLASNSVIAARDQIQKALRELRHASEFASETQRAVLEQARAEGADIWKRSSRPRASTAEAAKLADIARRVEAVRLEQR
ncbi:MAG TPA: hypothetical protein VGV60_05680 [Candidatus Polarisedimenticolia bacterium]|jgi:hypothetical protein|nr:hypothetical protein [Candidatus Polarisedimenticolia bacterium]